MSGSVQILAHRGASRAERENTIVAFTRAATMGADAVELDVRRTSDGALVVHHNPHLDDGRLIAALTAADLPVRRTNKVLEGQPHIVDAMLDGEVHLVINTTEGAQTIADSFSLRRTALVNNIPYYTTVAGARAAVAAIMALRNGSLEVAPLQSYLTGSY